MSASDIDSEAAENLAVLAATSVNPHTAKGVKMGKLIRASALMLLLACSASAGVMTYGVYQPPPPPPPQQQSSQEVPEPVETQETAETNEVTPLVIQIALDLFVLL